MSGLFNSLYEHHQQRKQERHEGRHGHHDDDENNRFGSHHLGRSHHGSDDDDPHRPHPHHPQEHGYAPPVGPPRSGHGGPAASGFPSHSGFGRGDFASDADIDRMLASGAFAEGQGRDGRGYESGYGGAGGERGNAFGRYDAPSGPPPGQGYGERANEYGRYDAPPGPPPGRGYQGQQQPHPQGYGPGDAYAPSYGGGPDRQNQYGLPQAQDRPQYEAPQGPPGHGRGQGNAPAGGFVASRDEDHPGYGGPANDRSEPPHRGAAASYYNQDASGQGDRYAHLATIAQEHGDDNPELYRRATQGLQERIHSQAQSRPPRGDDEDGDYKAHVDAHRKAYGGDDHGPMDADTIGAAAAMEAIKQTAAAAQSSKAPAGAFQAGKAGRTAQEGEEEETAARVGATGSGGLQDKLMALAMSQAGKLFDKKNAGTTGSSGSSGDKAQAMQSAAATAMQLYQQYQSKGKLESSDMSSMMSLAMKLL